MDEGTKTYLHTIDNRNSPDKIKIPIFETVVDTQTYQRWEKEMSAFLKEKNWERLVDGSLKIDPNCDSSEDPDVKDCYAIWKWMDEQLRRLIMDSLDDTWKDIVKETETAREMWDKLSSHAISLAHVVAIRDYLDAVTRRISSGELAIQTFKIKLRDIENYYPWMVQMKATLHIENMAGFIEGSIKDPYTIEQSQDKDLMQYSKKWKKVDEQVMKWIRDSLDDTLKEVVKECKTSKAIWDNLSTYFRGMDLLCSLEKRIPDGDHVMTNIYIPYPDKKNYNHWREQMKEVLESVGMTGFVDGSIRDPDPIGQSQHENVQLYTEKWKQLGQQDIKLILDSLDATRKEIAKESEKWKQLDEQVMKWIRGSLDDTLKKVVEESKTSKAIWDNLSTYFCRDQGSYTQLYTAILSGSMQATNIDSHNFDAELDVEGNTPLHIIIGTRKANHQLFEKVLNQVVQHIGGINPASTSTSPVLVDLVDRHGRNTLHTAARVDNLYAARMLVDKDPYLLFKEDNYKCLPVQEAISTPYNDTFRYLLIASKKYLNLLPNTEFINPFEGTHGVRLLNGAIMAGYMEVAYQLIKDNSEIASGSDGDSTPLLSVVKNFEKYHSESISWRSFDHDVAMKFKATESDNGTGLNPAGDDAVDVNRNAANVEVINLIVPIQELSYVPEINSLDEVEVKHNQALRVLRSICNQVRLLSTNIEKHDQYKDAAILAVYEDKHEALEEIAKHFPDAVWVKDDGHHLIELAIENRCEKVYNFLAYETVYRSNFFKDYEKKDGNNMLHLAAKVAPTEKLDQDAGAALQIRKGWQWYKHVEKFAPPGSNKEKNDDDDTPPEAFNKNYADLKKQAEKWMKTCATAYSVVAVLIMTITFAALITVPGGNSQGSEVSRVASPVGSQASPIGSPVAAPVQSPVMPPVRSPVVPRVRSPVAPRVRSPIAPPVWSTEFPPVQSQIGSVVPPVKSPAVSPVASPLGSPVAPPVKSQQDSEGFPVFLKKNSFRVFAITDTLSFAFATMAMMVFLSILTSRYRVIDIAYCLPMKLTFGITWTFISVVFLMAAFGEILHLMFGHKELLFIVIMFGCTVPAGLMFLVFQVKMIWRIYGRGISNRRNCCS